MISLLFTLLLLDITYLSLTLSLFPKIVESPTFRNLMLAKALIPVMLLFHTSPMIVALFLLIHNIALTNICLWWEKCHG